MSDFFKHGKLLKNGHNPGGRILRSLQVLKASEGTLNLIWVTPLLLLKRQEDEGSGVT
jgi:hypothetical protein